MRQSLARFSHYGAQAPGEPGSRHTSMDSPRTTSPLRMVPHDGMVTMEGDQANVRITSDSDPGLIGSALSLPLSQDDPTHIRLVDAGGNHHDDIVEHLDVIGKC